MLYANEKEIANALKRYIFFVTLLDRLLRMIEPKLLNDNRWFSIAPKIARKFWKQALSLEILFKHDWTIEQNGEEKILLDISSFYSLIRAMYEAYAVFFHLFKMENNPEENVIRFRLWELDGLQTRLKFSRTDPSLELVDRLKSDEKYIENIKSIIESLSYYKKLNEKHKKYLFKYSAWKFSNDSLMKSDQKLWQHSIKELIDRTGMRQEILSDMYSYYSMHVHAGYISILQNDDVSNEEKMVAKWVSIMNASFVTSCIIDDLSKMFPEGKAFYETLTEKENQALTSFTKKAKD